MAVCPFERWAQNHTKTERIQFHNTSIITQNTKFFNHVPSVVIKKEVKPHANVLHRSNCISPYAIYFASAQTFLLHDNGAKRA
ncbi:MAG TPA: hypothetical protein DCY07_07750 [Rhodospirillaceae bacterium]|nr:hypothetical protein [Rhodospirillaceae bacterium]